MNPKLVWVFYLLTINVLAVFSEFFHFIQSVSTSNFVILSTVFVSLFTIWSCHHCRGVYLVQLSVGLLISKFQNILPSARHTAPSKCLAFIQENIYYVKLQSRCFTFFFTTFLYRLKIVKKVLGIFSYTLISYKTFFLVNFFFILFDWL